MNPALRCDRSSRGWFAGGAAGGRLQAACVCDNNSVRGFFARSRADSSVT